jgi:hypothetical protein
MPIPPHRATMTQAMPVMIMFSPHMPNPYRKGVVEYRRINNLLRQRPGT